MKRSISVLALSALLFSCGSLQTSMPQRNGQQSHVPEVTLHLPAEQVMQIGALRPAGIQAQSAELSSWQGPRLFGGVAEAQGQTQLDVNSEGQAFINTTSAQSGQTSTSVLRSFKADGTALTSALGSGTGAATGLTVVRNKGQVWQLQQSVNNDVEVNVFDSSLNKALASTLKVPGGIAVNRDGFYQAERSGNGIAFLANTQSTGYVDVVSVQAQNERLVTTTTAVYFPFMDTASFDNSRVHKEFSAASDGTQYVVMTFPKRGCQQAACHSLVSVHKIKDGRVAWTGAWETYEPVRLEDISANTTDVVILMTAGGGNPDSLAASPQLTRVRKDCVILERYRVPMEGWRRDWGKGTAEERFRLIPNLKYISTDDHGKITANNENIILSGSFAEAFPNVYLLDRQLDSPTDRGTITGPVAFSGDYLYVTGTTKTGLGSSQQPPRAAGDPENGPSGVFLLPLDYQLNER